MKTVTREDPVPQLISLNPPLMKTKMYKDCSVQHLAHYFGHPPQLKSKYIQKHIQLTK